MKKLISLLLAGVLSFGMLSVSAQADITGMAQLLAELNIMQGDPDGNLRLEDSVSRAECAKITVAASSHRNQVATSSKTSPFRDVPAAYWGAPFITTAVKNGYCKGYLDATFRPNNTVLYEEAITMFLRVLGYTDEDFGTSWPEGQIGLAKNLGICDGVDKGKGDVLTRRDVLIMMYNLLHTNPKGGQNDYLNTLDRTTLDDVLLIASGNESASVATGKVYTSAGTFEVADNFDYSNIGKRGEIVLSDGDTIVAFIPNGQHLEERHVVYSLLGSGVVTYKDGIFQQVDFANGTTFYDETNVTSYQALSAKMTMGDVLKVYKKKNGAVDYVIYEEGNTKGPITVKGDGWSQNFGVDTSSAVIMRDGSKAASSDVQVNDIAYYSENLNMILIYSKKVTGIYEAASPNKDTPSSVIVSGKTYEIESVEAFQKLSSGGTLQYGDSVTLLLGKNGGVADVVAQSNLNTEVNGFLIETGRKATTVNGTAVTKPYAKVALATGETCEYVTAKEYSTFLNQAVRVTFQNGIASLTKISTKQTVSGTFTWNGTKKTLGAQPLASELKIIEVSTTEQNESAITKIVFPSRLDGVSISGSAVLYAGKNDAQQISELIITSTTGDMYSYGVITSASKNTIGMHVSGSYTYLLDGVQKSIVTSGTAYSVTTGQPVQMKLSATGGVVGMTPLLKTTSGKATNIAGANITISGTTYRMSDAVSIYTKDASYNYSMLSVDELANALGNYTLTLYSDKAERSGGRVRVIIAVPK